MGWFFTKAALLTFGGAYAVLPYVFQGAVNGYGWLTPAQMIDGLALGETTPGPLIMVVTFVGFVGGYPTPDNGSPRQGIDARHRRDEPNGEGSTLCAKARPIRVAHTVTLNCSYI